MERPAIHDGFSQYLHCIIEVRKIENGLREDLERKMAEKDCTGKNLKISENFFNFYLSASHETELSIFWKGINPELYPAIFKVIQAAGL